MPLLTFRWKQDNLIIDGTSYFELPQISDLDMSATYAHATNFSEHKCDLSVTSRASPSSSASQSSEMKNEFEVKKIIQARIDEQRKALSVRSQPVSTKNMRARSPDENSLNSGIVSNTPSELLDFANRLDPASTHNFTSSTATLHQHLTQSCIITRPQQQDQQWQSPQHQHQQIALAKVQPRSRQQ